MMVTLLMDRKNPRSVPATKQELSDPADGSPVTPPLQPRPHPHFGMSVEGPNVSDFG